MILDTILQIVLVTVPPLAVMLTAVLMMGSYTRKELEIKQLEIRLRNQQEIVPRKLQAYERMTLFLERISPSNLVPRVRQSDMTAKEMQIALIRAIREEYEHNLPQQIYISRDTWETISIVKDDLVKIVNITATSMPTEASSLDLSRAILEFYMQSEDILPTHRAIDMIKSEVNTLFS